MPREESDLFAGVEAGLREKEAARDSEISQLLSAVITGAVTGIAPEKTYAQLVDAYKSWVYTAIDKIGKTLATRPLRMFTLRRANGTKVDEPYAILAQIKQLGSADERAYALKEMGVEKREVLEHPFLELIHRPNDIMSRMVLWYETVMRMELGGLCAWYLPANGLGLPGEIWPLPLTRTAEIRPKVQGNMLIETWVYRDGQVNENFPPRDVLALKYPHPASPWQGFSPLMAQTYPYDIDLFLMQQQRSLLKNMGIPGIHLHTEQQMLKDKLDEIKEQIREQWGAATQSGRPLITHSGLKADKAGWSNKDMQVSSLAKYSREKLITSYDLSEAKLGLEVPSNRANMEVLDETFEKECIGPKATLIEEQINAFLLPRYDRGLFCEFERADTGNREFELLETEMEFRNFALTANGYLKRKGRPMVPWGNVPFIPFGVAPWGEELPEPPPPKEGEPENKASRTDRRNRRWQLFISRTAPWERLVTGQMQGYFRHQGEEVIARLNRLGPQTEAQYAGWSRKSVQEHIAKKGVGDNINIDRKAEAARLKLLFTPPVTAMVDAGGGRILRELGAAIVFNVNDPKVQKWIGKRMEMFSSEVSGTTFDDIKAILRQGFSEGKPLSAIADTLREKFDSYDKYRAPLISRTEVMAGNNMADILAIRQAGIEEKVLKTWITAGDENVRPTHVEAGAQYTDGIPIDEMFQVGNDEMDAPGNGSDPAETINCFLPGTLVSGRFVAGLKARYSGPAREIETARGHRLSVTPNHPVLTSRGLIPAKDLRKGDALLGYHGELRLLPGVVGDADRKNGPSLIEDVFEAFSTNGRMLEAATDADLHGDARFIDGEIQVVTAKGMLAGNRESSITERAEDLILIPARAGEPKMVSLGGRDSLAQRLLPSRGGLPCGGTLTLDQPATLPDLGPFQPFCLGLAADWDIPLPKMESNRVPFYSKGISESLDALPGKESGNHLVDRENPATIRAGSLVSKRDAVVSKDHIERREAHSEFIQDLLDRSAGTVSFDEISEVRDFKFVGHVYDLQTDVGWIIAQGIVTSNCRCAMGYEKA